VSSDGTHVWVASRGDGKVTEIDAATGTVVQTIPVGLRPTGVSSDGTHVWVTNYGDNTVSEIKIAPPPPGPPQPPPPPVVPRCHVPKVVGKKLSPAEKSIRKARCRVGKITRKHAAKSKRGKVTAQSPKPGRTLKNHAKVNLTVGT
jgi:YVTN family beta-propeller protein